jgi:uncharacterized protein YdeI (YjbR/CyaY-like superfamily)
MATKDPRVDAYIKKAPAFARPILKSLRAGVHAACPQGEETLKWGHPHFLYRGMLCGMAAFKQHCAFGFWKGSLVVDEAKRKAEGGMGHFGRLTSVAELPTRRALGALVKRAMALNEAGVKSPTRVRRGARPPLGAPPDLKRALAANRAAREFFAKLSPSGQREYIEWLTEAKQPATRARRLATTLDWLGAGKQRNWQYQRRAAPAR